MKLVNHFDDFLANTVNLNSTRIGLLDDSVEAIKSFIRNSSWDPRIRGFAPQGSWAHKTIIRPQKGSAFDADLLVYVDPVDNWEAKDYLNTLYKEFASSPTYKDKVRRFSHCVTIEYAGERKIDVAPCIKDRSGVSRWEVCNRTQNTFERSEPLEYTNWLIDRNSWSGSNSFRKVTRLLKYLRDIKTTFSCPSFLLTTLIGYRIYNADKSSSEFADVPTALKTLIGRLDDYLQLHPSKPYVANPVLLTECLSDGWDDSRYENFRSKINTYREWIDDAYDETDRSESIGKWRRVFGDDFAAGVALEEGRAVSAKAVAMFKEAALTTSSLTGDLVALVRQYGRRALPPGFNSLPYMHRPRWRTAPTGRMDVNVSASLYTSRNGSEIKAVSSMEALPAGRTIRFRATSPAGIPEAYSVHWRVTNTDEAAYAAGHLRGDFYLSHSTASRWEELRYRGVHMVEAFVVRMRDDRLVGRSDPFYVVID